MYLWGPANFHSQYSYPSTTHQPSTNPLTRQYRQWFGRLDQVYYDGLLSQARIRQITGYTESQVRTAIRAANAQVWTRSGRPRISSPEQGQELVEYVCTDRGRRVTAPKASDSDAHRPASQAQKEAHDQTEFSEQTTHGDSQSASDRSFQSFEQQSPRTDGTSPRAAAPDAP